jgi:hypothetical protein
VNQVTWMMTKSEPARHFRGNGSAANRAPNSHNQSLLVLCFTVERRRHCSHAMKLLPQLTRARAMHGLPLARAAPAQTAAASRLWSRSFSATRTAADQLPGLDPAKLAVTRTSTPKEPTPPRDLVFGKTFTGKLPANGVIRYHD